MSTVEVVTVIVLIVAGLACAVGVWALAEVARAMRSVKVLSDDTHARLNPLLDKADITVDAMNAELLRIDGIITRFEDAGERVSSASGTISGIVSAPTELVSEMALRVRRAWRDRHRESAKPPVPDNEDSGEIQVSSPEGENAS